MKRIILQSILFLALSLVSVASGWAYTYTVTYSGRSTTQGAGFTVSTTQQSYVSSYSSTQIVTSGSTNTYQISAYNYTNFFTPNEVEGYTASVSVSNTTTNRTVTITYSPLTKTYRMIFERDMLSGSGYTVNSAYRGNGTGGLKITSDDDAEFLVFESTSVSALPELTSANVSTYIMARSVSGYNTSYYVNTSEAELGYSANVTINYVTTADTSDPSLTWNDGTYEYSRIYTRQTGSTILLPEDEVAISLYKGKTQTVTDTVAYACDDIESYNTGYSVKNGNGDEIGTLSVSTTGKVVIRYTSGGEYYYLNSSGYFVTGEENAMHWTLVSYSGDYYYISDGNGHYLRYSNGSLTFSSSNTTTQGRVYTYVGNVGYGYAVMYQSQGGYGGGTTYYLQGTTSSTTTPTFSTSTDGRAFAYPDKEYTFNGTTATDDDGDGVGTTATYSFIGEHPNGFQGGTYFFTRTHQVAYSDLENAVIPRTTTHDGTTYKVTAIQKWGFCYNQSDQKFISSGTSEDCEQDYFWGCIDDHSNWYLKTVSFEYPSNVRSVGDYAFMSCVKLWSAIFPSSIEYLGQGIFEMDESLTDMRFETITANDLKAGESEDLIGTVRFNAIRMFTFWLCTSLETLELPDGIILIEGQQAGAALQYMLSLQNLRLPNTLELIGPHFLCCAVKLKTLTIPASVTYIDGASFHGCESLTDVYLLGPAAALQREYTASGSASGSSTFSANNTFCADQVAGCTFWTTQDYYYSYKNDEVWSDIDNDGNPNWLSIIPEEERALFKSRWVTAIFPHEVPNAYEEDNVYTDGQDRTKNGFGTGTKVAVMDYATATEGTDPQTGRPITLYDITFKLLADNDDGTLTIPAETPVLICPGKDCEHLMFTFDDEEDNAFKAKMSVDYTTSIAAKNDRYNSLIEMKGRYTAHHLMPWDFYFMYEYKDRSAEDEENQKDYTSPAKFWRVATQSSAPIIKACRCWWTITVNGARSDGQAANSQGAKFFNPDPVTSVGNIEIGDVMVKVGIYDLQGRRLDVSVDELPQGLFIVNGQKVYIK